MKFAAALLLAAVASATTVSYDQVYDEAARSLNTVACSDGDHGLVKRYGTLGSIPTFPYVGGSWEIAGGNSPQCGACYTVSFEGQSINVVGVDSTTQGLNLSKAALDKLTGGRAVEKGRIEAKVDRVDSGVCGLRASKRSIEFMA